jgi:hypothetical protein
VTYHLLLFKVMDFLGEGRKYSGADPGIEVRGCNSI